MPPAPDASAGFQLAIPPDALRPLVQAVVAEVLGQLDAARATLGPGGDRLAYGEAEAARMIGLHVHQLRDERLRGRIAASKIVGGRIAYRREDLVEYLMSRRVAGRFDGITFPELAHAYAENLARLFVNEADLHFAPPSLALRLFTLDREELMRGENILSATAAEASARRENVELRRAFDETMRDPAFLDEAGKQRLEIVPISGAQIERLLQDVYSTPRVLVDRAAKILAQGR